MKPHSPFGRMQIVMGILLLLLGILTLLRPTLALTGFVVVYGLLAVVTGVADTVFFVKMERHTGFGPTISLVAGVLSILAGVALLAFPGAGTWVLSLLFPLWFLAHCASRLAHLGLIRALAGQDYYILTLVVNLLGLVLGVLMLFFPPLSTTTAGLLAGACLVLLGAESIALGCSRMGRW